MGVLGGWAFSYERGTPAPGKASSGKEQGLVGECELARVQRFRDGLVIFKAHRLLYQSTLGLRVIKKKKVAGCEE